MTYRRRMAAALIASVVFHLVAGAVMALHSARSDRASALVAPETAPVVLNIVPEDQPQRLIETSTPADEPVAGDSPRISDKDANASDMKEGEDDSTAPAVDVTDSHEDPGRPAMPLSPPMPLPAPLAPEPAREQETSAGEEEEDETPPVEETETAMVEDKAEPAPEPAEEPEHETQEPAEAEETERQQLAKLEPPALPEPPELSRGVISGNAKNKGFLGHEAMQHEMAPYMLEIRKRVEKRWRALLQLNFSANIPSQAVLDCAIAPDGEVAELAIVDQGESASFARLCKEAIESAGPFGPFPFEVPSVYRNKNLEIRWTFSYMK